MKRSSKIGVALLVLSGLACAPQQPADGTSTVAVASTTAVASTAADARGDAAPEVPQASEALEQPEAPTETSETSPPATALPPATPLPTTTLPPATPLPTTPPENAGGARAVARPPDFERSTVFRSVDHGRKVASFQHLDMLPIQCAGLARQSHGKLVSHYARATSGQLDQQRVIQSRAGEIWVSAFTVGTGKETESSVSAWLATPDSCVVFLLRRLAAPLADHEKLLASIRPVEPGDPLLPHEYQVTTFAFTWKGPLVPAARSSTPPLKYSTGPDADQQRSTLSTLSPQAPLTEQLSLLLDSLSQREFSSLPIQLVSLDKTAHGLTATLDLRELTAPDEPPTSPNWDQFFQGSAGAENTRLLLLKTALQPSLDGGWIDAVVLLYGGEPGQQFDHIDLSPVFTRRNLKK